MNHNPFNPLISRLHALDSATLADVMVAMGLEQQVLSSQFKVLNPASKLVGLALCAQTATIGEQPTVSPTELDSQVKKDHVVIIATHASEQGALIGDNMLTSMLQNGASGFIVDGGIRDKQALVASKAALLYRYASPVNAYRFLGFSSFDRPVNLAGIWGDVLVNPNDLVVADADGAVVIPAQHAEIIIEASEVHQKNEEAIKSALTWGSSRADALAKFPRLKHVKKIENQ